MQQQQLASSGGLRPGEGVCCTLQWVWVCVYVCVPCVDERAACTLSADLPFANVRALPWCYNIVAAAMYSRASLSGLNTFTSAIVLGNTTCLNAARVMGAVQLDVDSLISSNSISVSSASAGPA